ncbi:MAG: hypothetical protein QGI32_14555 [Candidatus Latescibacteria bacterium]|jgi:hypothetical protein|nr:hypothetical protein [Candidatus Latescibacterota bacterium]
MNPADCILYSGGAPGAEAEFGANAERVGIEEVNFSFEGHSNTRQRGLRVLNHEELESGDVSLEYVSKLMNRRYSQGPIFRKILQTIWYQINEGQEIYVIGEVLADRTVKGGTGWGAEFAKLCNKPLYVYDQAREIWLRWVGMEWLELTSDDEPTITHGHITGTGSRSLTDGGRAAIRDLFDRSFS